MYYLGSRFYSPEIGRVICPDKISLLEAEPMKLTSKNLYAYCDNNPVSKSDLNGEIAIAAIGVVVGKVLTAAAPYALGAMANIAATGIAAKVLGNDYTLTDAAAAGVIGAMGAGKGILITLSKVGDVVYNAYSTWKDTGSIRVTAYAGVLSVLSNSIDIVNALNYIGYGAYLGDDASKAMLNFEYGIVSNVASSYETNEFYETVQEELEFERYRRLFTLKERQMGHIF